VLAHEIIVREMQDYCRTVVFSRLAESVGQAREVAHPHPHGEVSVSAAELPLIAITLHCLLVWK
jgi:hypothetical protein